MPASISEYVPQFVTDEKSARRVRRAWAAWGLTLAGVVVTVGAIVLAPVLRAHGDVALAQIAYEVFRAACHQIPERSFHLEGYPMAVCARCTGLYVGGLLGVSVYPLVRPLTRVEMPWRGWLLLAALPTTVDFALGFFGVWENTHLSRFLTASLLGVVAAFYIVPGAVDLSLTPWRQFFRPQTSREG
jgi:uncharacterized membrane protein